MEGVNECLRLLEDMRASGLLGMERHTRRFRKRESKSVLSVTGDFKASVGNDKKGDSRKICITF